MSKIKTLSELRTSFWQEHTEFAKEYRKRKKQNDYNGDIRFAWINFIDVMQKNDNITEKLRKRATL